MGDWPIGLSTGCFYRTPILDCLDAIRSAGFGRIEVCSFRAHLDYHNAPAVRDAADRIGQLGLEPYSFHAPYGNEIDISSPERHRRERAFQELQIAAEAAAQLNVRHFVIHPGPEIAASLPDSERLQRLTHAAANLDRLAQHCNRLNIELVLENMLPHLVFGNTREMLWILGAIESLRVGTCLDTGHAFCSGDLYRVMHKLSGHLKMVHANDNFGNHDDHLPPGRGKIDWQRLLNDLHRTGFQGTMILELAGDPQKDPEEILGNAREGRRHLWNLSRGIGLQRPGG